jgi:tellurite methyltransferase
MSDVDREKWDARYMAESHAMGEPSSFLSTIETLLPGQGRVLDVAGGTGRHAVWLARRGYDVTLVDVSPVGIDLARRRAARFNVEIASEVVDLERDPLPAGPWDVVVLFHYLHRPLFAAIAEVLQPGGLLVFAHSTRKSLERNPRPPAAYLIDEGEAAGLVADFELISYSEGWFVDGRHEARVVARRPRG